jgi:hypothetical protein
MTLLSGNSDSSSSSHGGRSSSSRSSDFVVAAFTVASFLWLLPALLTWAHLRHELHAVTEMDWLVVMGKHEPGLYGRRTSSKSGNFYKLHWPHHSVWDVVQLSQMLQSSLTQLPTTAETNAQATMKTSSSSQRPYLVPAAVANTPDNVPCLHQTDGSMICHGNLVGAIHTRRLVQQSWNNN